MPSSLGSRLAAAYRRRLEPRDREPRLILAIALAALLVAAAIVEAAVGDVPTPGLAAVVAGTAAVATIGRRRWPSHAVIVAFAGHLVLVVVNTSRGSTTADLAAEGIAVVLVTYSLGRWEEPRRTLRTGATIVALVVVAGLIERGNPVASALIGDPIPWILVALTGTVVRHRREARVDQIARTRLAERNDLAREIHDVVAHHVSAIAVQADAALAVAEQDPAAGHQALDAIRRTASLALDEMRSMVGVLRAPDASAELAPTGGRGDLERLVAHQPPHPAVELHTAGIDDLPATIAAAVYRLTQEAVTNARRHARDAGHVIIDVRVLDDPDRVRVVVADDGVHHRSSTAAGFGLIGMRERAESLGGTFEAGPRPGRGWEVRAELPLGRRR